MKSHFLISRILVILMLLLFLWGNKSIAQWNPNSFGINYFGNVGIGLDNPSTRLHIYGTSFDNSSLTIEREYDGWGGSIKLIGRRSSAVPSGRNIGNMFFYSSTDNSDNIAAGAKLSAITTENWSTSAHGTALGFFTTPNGTPSYGTTPKMIIYHNGNVGIGTEQPGTRIHLKGTTVGESTLKIERNDDGWGGYIEFLSKETTAVSGGREIGALKFRASSNSTSVNTGALINAFTTEDWGTSNNGTSLNFFTSTNGGVMHLSMCIGHNGNVGIGDDFWDVNPPSERLTVDGNIKANNIFCEGNVGIGTTDITEALTVKGKIVAEEVEVKDVAADYVFDEDYDLRSIEEVEQYILENKHLPDIPPSSETVNGIELGEFNQLLLQKIEELTLYVIELKKENEELKSKMDL